MTRREQILDEVSTRLCEFISRCGGDEELISEDEAKALDSQLHEVFGLVADAYWHRLEKIGNYPPDANATQHVEAQAYLVTPDGKELIADTSF